MKIIETNFSFKSCVKRNSTKYIILHHRAGNGDVQSIHTQHLSQGWSGIGYHFYVQKDGSIYRGRPEKYTGAHTTNFNSCSIGICFEGNFDNENMNKKQLAAGQELIAELKKKYPDAEIKKHKDFNATGCPGNNFPFKEIITLPKKELTTVNDIVWELGQRGVLTNKNLWLRKLVTDSNCYWLARKYANSKLKPTGLDLRNVNDIVWELHNKGVLQQKDLWLKKLSEDTNAYWLAKKMC